MQQKMEMIDLKKDRTKALFLVSGGIKEIEDYVYLKPVEGEPLCSPKRPLYYLLQMHTVAAINEGNGGRGLVALFDKPRAQEWERLSELTRLGY